MSKTTIGKVQADKVVIGDNNVVYQSEEQELIKMQENKIKRSRSGNIIQRTVWEIYDIHNHPPKVEATFYPALTTLLRNEPNKIEFLDQLQSLVDSDFDDHFQTCEKTECDFAKKKNIATKIITVIKSELGERNSNYQNKTVYNFTGPVSGAVGNNAQVINNNFAPIENACREANLSIEDIEKLKLLFEKKDKHSIIEAIKEFGLHTASIIAGYSIMELTK